MRRTGVNTTRRAAPAIGRMLPLPSTLVLSQLPLPILVLLLPLRLMLMLPLFLMPMLPLVQLLMLRLDAEA